MGYETSNFDFIKQNGQYLRSCNITTSSLGAMASRHDFIRWANHHSIEKYPPSKGLSIVIKNVQTDEAFLQSYL